VSTVTGSATVKVSSEVVYDVHNGNELRETYKGAEASIDALTSAFRIAGYTVTRATENGVHVCQVRIANVDDSGGYSGTETPVDKWQVNFDFFQTSVWDHPGIMYGIQVYADSLFNGNYDNALGAVRGPIENYLKGKKWDTASSAYVDYSSGPLTPEDTGLTAGEFPYKLYCLLMRGTESFEVERPVLSRVRTYSAAYLTRFTMPAWPTIYTTAQLISAYAIPAVTQSQMPSDPAFTPTDCTWGWKERRHNLEIDYQGKVTETLDWVFAAWSNLLYLAQT
jgi:hypothetical protein